MRTLLSFAICSAVALPGAALAQDVLALPSQPAATTVAPVDVTLAPTLAPLPTVQPTVDAPPPVSAAPPPAPVSEAAVATPPTEPTTVAPVLIAKEEKDNDVAGKVGMVVGGVAGGVAGAAVGGPVGKFAGGFLGKRVVGGIFGVGKDKVPEVTVAEAAPSADVSGKAAVAEPATAPPLKEKLANR
ncbi:MAG: hypothetical protein KKE02_16550 [Alphaproteobacteria bacterium]|nr:hypothetical protein [Alphaproteobacteria bacterium]MBU1515813.1 hypothetical protein [Alphaproteobacteria bacterium]MBU2094035.1 hypothetical protein [Alphaproteobacteria bacterium]MBU2152634.1 hypothetical protein [Alphaproteobacteria bacterium]MBU2308819.1 hypothetical protein [Alphaproteobacteria bacterium]